MEPKVCLDGWMETVEFLLPFLRFKPLEQITPPIRALSRSVVAVKIATPLIKWSLKTSSGSRVVLSE
jgi:hypothetical protein